MKTKLLALLLPLLLMANGMKARTGALEISCSLSEKDVPVKDYTIMILRNGHLFDSVFAEKALPIFIMMDVNTDYSLRFIKKDFRDRIVIVETKVPVGKEKQHYSYDFDIEMIRKDSAPNTMADLPIAFISYDTITGGFEYSATYAASIAHMPASPDVSAAKNNTNAQSAETAKRNSRKKVRKGI